MMAFERLEPFGPLHDEFMHGQLCALTANINRDPKKGEPLRGADFMPALGRALGEKPGEAVLLADDEAQSLLIIAKVFGGVANG